MRKIAEKAPKEVKVQSEAERQEDYYKGFRSAVVLVWMFCNFALAAVVLSTAGLERIAPKSSETQRSTIYMAVVLWSVAGLSLFRFTGAVWFLIVRIVSNRCFLAGKMDELIRFRSFGAFDDRASASPWHYVGIPSECCYVSVLLLRYPTKIGARRRRTSNALWKHLKFYEFACICRTPTENVATNLIKERKSWCMY